MCVTCWVRSCSGTGYRSGYCYCGSSLIVNYLRRQRITRRNKDGIWDPDLGFTTQRRGRPETCRFRVKSPLLFALDESWDVSTL